MRVLQRARTTTQAIERHRGVIQRSLGCIAGTAQWRLAAKSEDVWALVCDADLRRDDGTPLYLTATQEFYVGPRPDNKRDLKVNTAAFAYTLADDADRACELFSWHWHPPVVVHPHLHIGKRHPDYGALAALHVPCGRVAFEDVVQFAIEELRVKPARDDWQNKLADARSRFKKYRTWS